MKLKHRFNLSTFVLFVVIFATACSSAATPTPPPPPTAAPEPTATKAPPTAEPSATPEPTATIPANLVRTLEDVKKASIQIEAQGTFIDPEEGMMLNASGRGSGFIIDESGLAVTNNHVVTGAGLLKVFVGGETKARNARIVGVSECSDLAIIDLEGDGYPYLDWYSGKVSVGLEVYAAGFPLGDPEFTLTRGIISKEKADGETDWASVDYVLEHDATINPGNSGGPLVTKDGQVVGVNYASDKNANQYFAIAQAEALDVIAQLRTGQDVDSLGINGVAVNDGDQISGIWVASVKSGSPADKAGVEAGDIVTSLEDLILASDGTMADYCDILRSHDATDTLNLQVLRFDTEEILEGQINGDPLVQSFSFAQTLNADVSADPTNASYTDYTTVSDDTGAVEMEVPASWDDLNGTAWVMDDRDIGVAISASPNLDEFYDTYGTPGVFFGASKQLAASYNEDSFLDDAYIDFENCTYEGRDDYQDELYTGRYDLWTGCGDADSAIIQLAAVPESRAFVIFLQIQAVTEGDLEAVDHILNSFIVVDDLP